MRVKRFRLDAYGPFSDSSWIELSPTVNIFVGENNAGKSAVLRSFLRHLPAVPHRDAVEWRSEYLRRPKHSVEVEFSGAELDWTLRTMGEGNGWYIASSSFTTETEFKRFALDQLKMTHLEEALSRSGNSDFEPLNPVRSGPLVKLYSLQFQQGNWAVLSHGSGLPVSGLPGVLSRTWKDKVFVFEALRSSPGRMGYAAPSRLDANAGTLAIQLNGLQRDSPELFNKLVFHLTSIFPTVGNLSVSAADNAFEIRVWATREQRTRELSFSLDDSGTGIAQAIAILYIAMTMNDAVLVIDEIGSYLHPAAAKALLRILQSHYPQHQYIISTHSPEVLSAGRDAKVFWVRKHDFESTVTEVDLSNLRTLREVTGQLGVSMTDVFAAEHIVWVEGETEEACFPMLLAQSGDKTRSVLFIAVLATGDFQDKRVKADKIFQIYERLTSATAPVVSKVAFNFDSEDLAEDKKVDLNKRSGGRIHFLPRRNLESYLLQPAAIARVIVEAVKGEQVLDVTQIEASVTGELQKAAIDRRYGTPADPPAFDNEEWLSRVDGASLLRDLFGTVTEQTLEYRKTTHSVALVKDLLDRQPDKLASLVAYVSELVNVAKSQG
ncbi:ATP-binding protein [Rhizobium leguminosarum bv. trifolii]|uniref:ATP-dependent nuclease n=1 Tax=Rhizobium leguminosarum TaxID=384 RepID=UPI00140F5932|nr:AAA family ATPase [Rhizobium leguminosarum]QIO51210.1 ATP-binding protein [Rhizobium leguminosarum bv. trifolii]